MPKYKPFKDPDHLAAQLTALGFVGAAFFMQASGQVYNTRNEKPEITALPPRINENEDNSSHRRGRDVQIVR